MANVKTLFSVESLEAIKAKAEELTEIYNDRCQNGNPAPYAKFTLHAAEGDRPEYYSVEIVPVKNNGDNEETTILLRECIVELINSYTCDSKNATFRRLKSCEDPMLQAVTELTFPTIRLSDEKVGDNPNIKISKAVIKPAQSNIDLLSLHKFVGGNGIGKNSRWMYYIEKLNFLLTAQAAIDLDLNPAEINSSFAMDKISKELSIGVDSVGSKTKTLKALQTVISSMIGDDYKALTHDANYLLKVYSKKGGEKLSVVCSRHSVLRQHIAMICHRIVTNGKYTVDYKKIKEK